VNSLTAVEYKPQAIRQDFAQLQSVDRSIKKLTNVSAKRSHTLRSHVITSCKCHGQSTTIVYLKWPLFISRNVKKVHGSHCAYSAIEDAVTELSVQFSICIAAFKTKAQVAVALSRGGGSSPIDSGLKAYRVVDKRSPAFRLLGMFERKLGPDPRPDAWERAAHELYKLFETRAASPHDRLTNGQTLLHVRFTNSCSFMHADCVLKSIFVLR
jgi:hypothetical protein